VNERTSLRISRGLQRIAAAVALTAYLVLTVFGASVVFCHEADGSVAVEWSGAECCVEVADAGPHGDEAARVSVAPSSGGANCVECVDVPAAKLLTSTGANERRDSIPKPDLGPCVPAVAVRHESWTDRAETFRRLASAATSPPPRPDALRTVFLRC
jgi:hypothetical protein